MTPPGALDPTDRHVARKRVERWFRRRGLPHFIDRYNASADVWTRALPALVILFALQMLGIVNVTWRSDDAPDSTALEVAVLVTGLVALLGLWIGLNLRRGRRLLARPTRVGRLELVIFIVGPVLPAILRLQLGDLIASLVVNTMLVGTVYVVASYGLVPLVLWVGTRLLRQAATVLGLLVRALPLLLLIVGLLYLTTEVWQSAGSQTGTAYLTLLLLFVVLALAFLAVELTRESPALSAFASWDEVRPLIGGTPAEHLLVNEPMPVTAVPPPTRRQRFNAAVVLFVTQTIQVGLVSLLVGLFLLAFGLSAVPLATVTTWTGSPPNVVGYLDLGSSSLAVTEPMLRVVGFLTAFTSLYFSVASLTDATYRREFYEDTASQLRRAFAVRAVYLACVVLPAPVTEGSSPSEPAQHAG